MSKKIGIFLLIISLSILIINFNFKITGGLTRSYSINFFSFFNFIGLILLIASFFILMYKKSLDMILIPIGTPKEDLTRTEKAIEEYHKRGKPSLMICGEVGEKSVKNSARMRIYKKLREAGIKPYEIKLSKGANTLENLTSALQKLEGAKEIGIVSYPKHLERIEYIFDKTKKQGKMPKDVKIILIPTKQSVKEFTYGTLANVKEKYGLKLDFLNNVLKKIFS